MDCYVHWNGGAWLVKERTFLEQQKKESLFRDAFCDRWWEAWHIVYDVDGIEHARDKARLMWGLKGELWIK